MCSCLLEVVRTLLQYLRQELIKEGRQFKNVQLLLEPQSGSLRQHLQRQSRALIEGNLDASVDLVKGVASSSHAMTEPLQKLKV